MALMRDLDWAGSDFWGCNLHLDMSATTTVALPTKGEHPQSGSERLFCLLAQLVMMMGLTEERCYRADMQLRCNKLGKVTCSWSVLE
jgi:hypothetical protein